MKQAPSSQAHRGKPRRPTIDTFITILEAAGGLGLFLIGMTVMTDGLKSLAGDTVRSVLMRFTRSPLSGAVTGATATALLQSSSATTVATVGFVGAGLVTFPSALGVVFGANLGTTLKGWVIALLGFRYDLDAVFMPMIFVGAVMRLVGGRRTAATGYATAGFALVFVGITVLQDAMSGFEGILTPESLPRDTVLGRLLIVGIGFVATLITQSSSAGVAATITAIHAGAITFEQGAALVIGMDIGTTVTAAVATIGGSVDAKRTGYSHVVYNLMTASGALVLITPFATAYEWIAPGRIQSEGEIAIVAFHMFFNVLGIVVVLPFAKPFAALMIRLVPEKREGLVIRLERTLLESPALAMDAVQKALAQAYETLLTQVRASLTTPDTDFSTGLSELETALEDISTYLDQIHVTAGEGSDWERLVALMHALDHAQRLLDRCEDRDRIETARVSTELSVARTQLLDAVSAAVRALDTREWGAAIKTASAAEDSIAGMVTPFRDATMADMARGEVEGPRGSQMMQALRWMRRASKHIASIAEYLERAYQAAGKENK